MIKSDKLPSTLVRKWALTLRGIFLIATGIVLFTVRPESTKTLVLAFAAFTFLAGASGLVFANSNKESRIKKNWLIIEAGADLLWSVIAMFIYFQSKDLTSDFLMAFAFFSLLFAFMQVLYLFQMAEKGVAPNVLPIVARAFSGIVFGLFGIVLIMKANTPGLGISMINFVSLGPVIAGIALIVLSARMYMVRRTMV